MASESAEVRALAADLAAIAGTMPGKARQAFQQTLIRTKKSYADDAKKSMPKRVAKTYAPTIDYTLSKGEAADTLEGEVGPNLERYGRKTRSVGGKSLKGGLSPSFGFLDDPDGTGGIRAAPSRARQRAEKFAAEELVKGIEIAAEQSMKARGL